MRDWLTLRAATSPDATALIAERTETYQQLHDSVEAIAARLAHLGMGPGDHLGMLVDAPVAVRLVHAAMRLGCVVIPLSPVQTESELAVRIRASDLDLLVCEDRKPPSDADLPVYTLDALADEPPSTFDPPEWKDSDPLCLLSTSGTTGAPKFVVLTVGNVRSSAVASAFRLGVLPDDRWCSPLAYHHMGGLAPVYRSVLYGTALIPAPTDPEELLETLSIHEATGVSIVPVLLDRLLSTGTLPDSLRFVLLGGAPATDDLIERCTAHDVPVCPSYGMTETASQIATARPAEAREHGTTVGRPIMFTDVTIIDANGRPVPPGTSGEIVVSGPTVMPNYYKDPEATRTTNGSPSRRTAFCSHGFRTGDRGHLDENGRLWIDGRLDDRIITGGNTVDPKEIATVLRDHPGINEAAVLGLPDDEWGQLCAALIERSDDETGSLDASAVESHCRSRLARHKIPRRIAWGPIPRTDSGTVDRDAVRSMLGSTSASV